MTRILIALALTAALAPAARADSSHKGWSPLQSMGSSISRPTSTAKDGSSNTLQTK